MSPSESDLRAALQHGEEGGFQVSADAIMREGQAIRARRVRILSGTAAAVLVAAGAVGLATARGGNGGSNAGGGNSNVADKAAGNGGGARHGLEGDAPGRAPTPLPSDAVPAAPAGGTAQLGTGAQCPASAPHLLTPGGGGTGQFGADDALFAKPVKTLVVCAYATTVGSAPGRLVLSDRAASDVVSSMETAAPESTAPTPCDAGPTSTAQLLDFIGVTPKGSALPPVTATLTFPACNVRITNGTAVRYNWSPPAGLTDQLRGLSPPKVPPRSVPNEPSGIVNGSPVRS